ncbi:ABC transporter ATP-binding protein [Candidimonas nitroreducens]|uniref:ABC transporter ATP-binding protein n=1 Tax=Candidimonas nitroreducens TaxID=683354 RepID=A0A225MX95_9BURK|nr:putative 2-aminoethylphosphonate ABC transporter ATP-binding protein [Candidimonas nitroreducens]OWT65754.1 ABC transporter ATP-binding protein [Candidimonas nitroreducens]
MNPSFPKAAIDARQTPARDYLRIQGLCKRYGDFHALRNINLEISEGEFVCFLGPSGCGKTTLLRAIAGLDPQSEGTISQAGRDISQLPAAQRDYGIVFQSYALFPNLTIAKNIAFGLEAIRQPRDAINARVAELLQLVGLADQAEKYPAQLSGGQQQRVALARAMAASPGLLLLDEPLSALDAKVRVHLRHEIKELQRRLGVTTIMVTHDQEEALSMADKIVVMNHGVIEQVGTPQEIYCEPQSLFVSHFIGEANQYPAVARDSNTVTVGDCVFRCRHHGLAPATHATMVMRPDDIVIQDPEGAQAAEGHSTLEARIESTEFLGSFWRIRMYSELLRGWPIVADCSFDIQRRWNLVEGRQIVVELPADRLLIFKREDA